MMIMLQSLPTILAKAVSKVQHFDYEKLVLVAVALHAYAHLCACMYMSMCTIAILVA
jgi:hypothetical protein